MVLLAAAIAFVASGCVRADIDPTPSSSRAPSADPTVALTAGPTAVIEPDVPATLAPTPEPSRPDPPRPDDRFSSIDTITLGDGGKHLHIEFVGWKEFSANDPCSARYTAAIRIVDAVLEIGLREERGAGIRSCDSLGHGRTLEVDLPTAFRGTSWRDRARADLHFLAAPAGLVEITLPVGWQLVAEADAHGGPNGRWMRTYAPFLNAPDDRTLVLYQAFDGPSGVTGGTEERGVLVGGQPATLYRFPPTGEVVLVWMVGRDGLALVADEEVIPIADLIAIAETARGPER